MLNYGNQFIDSNDIRAVVKILKRNLLTQGPEIEKFQNTLKSFFKSKFCKAVSNGTAALHLAGLALRWKKDDVVLTIPTTFIATANCILYNKATPKFVDIDKSSYTIDVNKLESKIKYINNKSRKVVAVIATDYAGNPCDWEALKFISKKYNVKLINDNCHAMGAKLNNDHGYAVKYADIVTQSYHPVKHITTGEGGAILTNNKIIDEKVTILRSHGIVRDPKKMNIKQGPWYYEMHDLGFNYRITDFQCALGLSQLKKLKKFIKKRREVAKIYDSEFADNKFFVIPRVRDNCEHAYHLYPLQINFEKLRISKKELINKMRKKNINLQVHYIPIHLQPFYKRKFGFKKGDFPVAEKFYENEVSLPIFFSLKQKQVYKVIKSIKSLCRTI